MSNHYQAQYIIQLNSPLIEFELTEDQSADIKLLQVSRLTETDKSPAMFQITLTFSASDSNEANRIAAINTDSSVIVIPECSGLINYTVKISKQQLLWEKIIVKQLISCGSLSA